MHPASVISFVGRGHLEAKMKMYWTSDLDWDSQKVLVRPETHWRVSYASRRHRTSPREALEIKFADFKRCVLLPLLLLLFE